MTRGRLVYVKAKKTAPGDGAHWSQKKKADAVKTWLATGNLSLTAATLNVPLSTMKFWRQQPWWADMVGDLREQDNIELDKKLSNIISKTLDAAVDRIENGDFEFDRRTGQLRRVPVKLKDIHKVTSDFIDKRHVLRNQPTSVTEKQVGMEDRLLKLAEQFAALATGKKPEEKEVAEVIDGEFEELPEEYQDAIYAERPERLQEGTTVGEETQAQSSEGSGSTQCSEVNGG